MVTTFSFFSLHLIHLIEVYLQFVIEDLCGGAFEHLLIEQLENGKLL